jgi:predicted ArsR family transcriptional regulator
MDLSLLPQVACLREPRRRAIFERLAQGPARAAELAGELAIPGICVARHLRMLERAGLVAATRATPAVYRVDCPGWATVQREIDAAWARNTARLFAAAG